MSHNQSPREEYAELAVLLALSAKPHSRTLHKSTNTVRNALKDAATFMRHANKLAAQSLAQCNGIERYDAKAGQRVSSWNEADEKASERKIEKSRAAIKELMEDYRVNPIKDDDGKFRHFKFNRDPRGCAVTLFLAAGHWHSR